MDFYRDKYYNFEFEIHAKTGYINATLLCKENKKSFCDWGISEGHNYREAFYNVKRHTGSDNGLCGRCFESLNNIGRHRYTQYCVECLRSCHAQPIDLTNEDWSTYLFKRRPWAYIMKGKIFIHPDFMIALCSWIDPFYYFNNIAPIYCSVMDKRNV